MSTNFPPFLRWLAPGISILSLSACANFADIQTQAQLMQAPPAATARLPAVWQNSDWASQIGGAELAHLIKVALAHNPGLDIAKTRIAAATALVANQRAEQLPSVAASLGTSKNSDFW